MKVSIVSLGCKVNHHEGEQLAQLLSKNGYEVSYGYRYADVYVLNTCAVTSEAESKSRQAVNKLNRLNSAARIIVCGCAGQLNAQQFACLTNVKIVNGVFGKANILQVINEWNAQQIISTSKTSTPATIKLHPAHADYRDICTGMLSRIRECVKIQDGCNNYCSYCIVPHLRGASRSKAVENVIMEIERAQGCVKEIVLSGINLTAYGQDIGSSLTQLLTRLVDVRVRLRLGSLEVGCINQEFLQAANNCANFCPQFHLSLQSGSDYVLKSMNRHYTTAQFAQAVDMIRQYFPQAAVTTDIIVGYPTETQQDFEQTLQFAKQMAFSDIHCFGYSVRKGTVAEQLPQLSGEVKASRVNILNAVKKDLKLQWAMQQIGTTQNVLVETVKNSTASGYSKNYCYVQANATQKVKNNIVDVKITHINDNGTLVGDIVRN